MRTLRQGELGDAGRSADVTSDGSTEERPGAQVAAVDPHSGELPPLCARSAEDDDLALVENGLAAMAPILLSSELGLDLVNTNFYLDNEMGPKQFAIHLRAGEEEVVYLLDLNKARFVRVDGTMRDLLLRVPFGIDVNLTDFAEVFRGRLHIWELATARMNQWYTGDRLRSPVAFLYGVLSE